MKKALIASILGIAASVATSYGQGYIVMESYYNDGVNPAHFSAIQAQGLGYLGANWSAQLLYSIGGNPFQLAAGSQQSFYPGSQTGVGDPLTTGAGIFIGPNVTIPGYVSGSVSFIVQVFNGATYASSSIKGDSLAFSIASLQTNPLLPAGDLINNNAGGGLQPFTVPVPEPSTFALAGLGSAAMLIFRRRKA